MKIRTITCSIELNSDSTKDFLDLQIEEVYKQNKTIKNKYKDIRTSRINIIYKDQISILNLSRFCKQLEYISTFSKKKSIRWISVSLNSNQFENIKNTSIIVTSLLVNVPNLFIHLIIDKEEKSKFIYEMFAATIIETSKLTYNGFDNFRLGISNGSSMNTPFFPFANFDKPLSYSVGLEAIDILITDLFASQISNKCDVLNSFEKKLSNNLKELDHFLIENSNLKYNGIDSSLAPVPRTNQSIGLLYELLGVNNIGTFGSIAITANLTSILKRSFENSKAKSVGFNGVMFSPLEDDWLAKQSIQQLIDCNSLLLYSTVCGCGLDMIPVPGDIFSDTLASLISDTLALSNRHKKPLGIRIVPIPGKSSNEKTSFNHDFFSDMRIIKLPDSTLPKIYN